MDIPTPLSESQKVTLANEILSLGVHEMQHAAFDTTQQDPATGTIAPAADCNLDTIVTPPGVNVEFLLSEISAITSAFPVIFENIAKSGNAAHLLELEEQRQAFDPDEGLLGAIQKLQCVCSCPTVESFVTKTVDLSTAVWRPDEKLAFLKTMTLRIPNVWPKLLHK